MKKLVSILISVFYLTVTIGLIVDVHYCYGEIESVRLYGEPEDCCCGDDSSDISCCHSDVQFIKFENKPTLVSGSRLIIQPLAFDLLIIESRADDLLTKGGQPFYFSTSDLPPPELPVWLLFCSLIYYG
ncbi:MAG: hypothetical protein AB2L24_22645 [Mangrovibacterium sp.]